MYVELSLEHHKIVKVGKSKRGMDPIDNLIVSEADEIEFELGKDDIIIICENHNIQEKPSAQVLWDFAVGGSNKKKTKTEKKSSGKRLSSKTLEGAMLSNTDKKARESSVMGKLQKIIEDEMEEISFESLSETFQEEYEKDEQYTNGYIRGAIREGYIEINEEL